MASIGYTSSDIDLVCSTIGNIEFTALGTGKLGTLVPYTAFGYTNKKKQKNNDNNLGYISIDKMECFQDISPQ